jgi:hypothetical protein
MKSYWEAIEPLFNMIDTGNGYEAFAATTASTPRSSVLLFSAHMTLAEVYNGGFLQLFWNCAGVLVPEAIEGFATIGMPKTSAILQEAAHPLGDPYPRDRDERWDALLASSGRSAGELEQIFKTAESFYLGFQEATLTLQFDAFDKRFWKTAITEGGGFQRAATRYANAPLLIQ